jgi:hypothetical protein
MAAKWAAAGGLFAYRVRRQHEAAQLAAEEERNRACERAQLGVAEKVAAIRR